MRRDEARVRRAQGLVAQVILADPGQAIAPQALSLVAHEWLEAGVAGFRQQHGADADAKIRDPRRAFADVRKRDGEICTRRDLEQDLRQIDTGQPSRDGGPQRHQRRGFLDLVEGAHDQLVLPVDAFETHGWIVGEARGHRAVGLIQLVA